MGLSHRRLLGAGAFTAFGTLVPAKIARAQQAPAKAMDSRQMPANARDLTTQIIKHVLNSRLEAIPKVAIERAKLSILDTLASAIGGSSDPIAHRARQLAALSGGKPECTVWISGEKLPACLAVLVNATTARAIDFDETSELITNGCHASAYDIPPALALAERDASITGRELLSAVVTGMDLHLRLARSVTTSALSTGRDNMVAVWGPTAVSTKLLRLDEEKTRNAFGIAYAHAAGEIQMYEEGTQDRKST